MNNLYHICNINNNNRITLTIDKTSVFLDSRDINDFINAIKTYKN